MKKLHCILITFAFTTLAGFSRPISYPDGITIMNQNSQDQQRLHIHYSPTMERSLGVVIQHYQTPSLLQFHSKHEIQVGAQWNELLYRHNTKTSQTNLYLKTLPLLTQWGGSLGIAGDSETRRLFASYEIIQDYNMEENGATLHHSARIGIAPYIAEFNSIHLWFMLQAHQYLYSSDNTAKVDWTPLIRTFKGPILAELGSNFQDTFLFNMILRL